MEILLIGTLHRVVFSTQRRDDGGFDIVSPQGRLRSGQNTAGDTVEDYSVPKHRVLKEEQCRSLHRFMQGAPSLVVCCAGVCFS